MAKQRTKVLRARKSAQSRDDDALLIRSAESLGRVIGSLQRQVQGTTRRMSTIAKDAIETLPELPQLPGSGKTRSRKTSGKRKTARPRKTSKTSRGRKNTRRSR